MKFHVAVLKPSDLFYPCLHPNLPLFSDISKDNRDHAK